MEKWPGECYKAVILKNNNIFILKKLFRTSWQHYCFNKQNHKSKTNNYMQQNNLSQLNNTSPIHNNFLYSINLEKNVNCISPNTSYPADILHSADSFFPGDFGWENFSNELEFE